MTLMEQRKFLARLVRVNVATLDVSRDGDLLRSYEMTKHGVRLRLHDKLSAIAKDNELAGDRSEERASDTLRELVERIQM
jgi:hypothetical protein